MAESFLGEIRIFGFTFAPQGWALCNGQLMAISQNTALFSLLGTTYGGNGTSTFALPDLQGRVAVHFGNGVGLSPYVEGQRAGSENATLTNNQMPAHTHTVAADGGNASSSHPGGAVPARPASPIYGAAPDGTLMNAGMIGTSGGSQPFSILQPCLAVNFCIALQGIFPSRN